MLVNGCPAVKIEDLVYVLSWPVLFFRTLLRNLFR
jgi:hypothetical protein